MTVLKRIMMHGKIHRATITHCDVDYVGSLTLDSSLMKAADMLPGEQIHVVDVDNGARFVTYLIEGGPGEVGVNGAAAHLVEIGHKVIIIAYGEMEDAEARTFTPRVILVDGDNHPITDEDGAPAHFKETPRSTELTR